jgi:heme exporter protein A
MLDLVELTCLRGERLLFRHLSLSLPPGQLLAVSGENGSGKTSLLRMVCGLLPPEHGSVRWQGRNIVEQRETYHGQVIYIGHLNGLKDDLTPLENLAFFARLAGISASQAACADALTAMGLGPAVQRLPSGVLSQGQKRRATLARLWVTTRPLWILDEPFAALDAAATTELTRRMEAHVKAGGIVMAATHQDIGVAPDMLRHMRMAG